jgi:hypothetical protein
MHESKFLFTLDYKAALLSQERPRFAHNLISRIQKNPRFLDLEVLFDG